MHVGIGKGEPAIDVGTILCRTIAAKSAFGILIGQVVQDRRVLGQDPAIDIESRH